MGSTNEILRYIGGANGPAGDGWVVVLNGDDYVEKTQVLNQTISGTVTAPRFISNVAQGTAPLGVTSTTVVPALIADMVDGIHGTDVVRKTGDSTITGTIFTTAAQSSNANALVKRGYIDTLNTGDEVYVGTTQPTDPAIELWYDTTAITGELQVGPKGDKYTFPASLALVNASWTGLSLTYVGGDDLMDELTMTRPTGWNGPSPLGLYAFKAPGVYTISGELSTASIIGSGNGSTFTRLVRRDGSNISVADQVGNTVGSYGMWFTNSIGYFKVTWIIRSTDHAFYLGAYNGQGANVNTWTSPGELNIIKIRDL